MNLKRGGRVFASLVALLLILFAILKESREPYIWLFIDDLVDPKPPPLELHISEGLAVRLYSDTRPHIGKVARLQKGLVLVVDTPGSRRGTGRERIEEGFGLGLPLIEVDGQAYLSRTAAIRPLSADPRGPVSAGVWGRDGDTLVKEYHMDTLDTPSGFLRRKYEPVPSIGTVTVRYTRVAEGLLEIAVDFSGLQVQWNRAYLMNEQGAQFFTRYEESGLAVQGDQFGKWQPTEARQGCIVAHDGSVRFCVETEQESLRYYGRERYNQYYWVGVYSLSWAGIDLEVEAPADPFQYHIVIESAAHD